MKSIIIYNKHVETIDEILSSAGHDVKCIRGTKIYQMLFILEMATVTYHLMGFVLIHLT